MSGQNYYNSIVEAVKAIDTNSSEKWIYDEIVSTSTIIEEQKVYFWIRLYLKEETPNIQIGDDVLINWTPSGEKLSTKFIAFGKKGLDKDHHDQVSNYVSEDDKRILCLMVDERVINFSNDIPFIRTLFKTGHHYEYQLIKREELQFIIQRNGIILEYYDCDF